LQVCDDVVQTNVSKAPRRSHDHPLLSRAYC
jgi:hypothetical protein